MMRCLCVVIACLVVASTRAARIEQVDRSLDEDWKSFKSVFKKSYSSLEKEAERRRIWERNLRYIEKHNLEADMNMHSYRLGVNKYADLTTEEYRRRLLGFKYNGFSSNEGSSFLAPANIELPSTVDWRKKGYVTDVKNQDVPIDCGSCWAFSTTGALEGQHFKKTGRLVSLSEQNLVDCNLKNNGCNGGDPMVAFEYIKQNGGIDTETSYPYTAEDGFCHFKRSNVGATDTGFAFITPGNETALQIAVATIGPISVSIDALSSFSHYKSGVYDNPECSNNPGLLNHAVLAVGYGTFQGKDYWLVKNSWGRSWGMDGYVMMSRNKHNQCGIATHATYPLV